MKKFARYFLSIMCLFSHLAQASQISIKSDEARAWADSKGHELLETLSMDDIVNKYAKLDKMMTEDVNLDYVSNFVIGKYARKMNKEQKSRYHELFQRYALSLYKRFNLKLFYVILNKLYITL